MNKISKFLAGVTLGAIGLIAIDKVKTYSQRETQNVPVTFGDVAVYAVSEQPKVEELVLEPKSRHVNAEDIERSPYSELLFLKREDDDGKRTLGKLYWDSNYNQILDLGDEELCYTLERPSKDNKPNVSSIPVGHYPLKRGKSSRLGDIFYVKDVLDRTDILIHVGNTVGDTTGCILVGNTKTRNYVGNSRKTIMSLVERFGEKEGLGLRIVE